MSVFLGIWGGTIIAAIVVSLICLIVTSAEISDYGRSKERQRNLRYSWLGLFTSLVAPLVAPALIGWGVWEFAKIIGKSLNIAFGRNKVVEDE